MKKFAITGNIACGKSTAFKVIENLGFPVVDCDDIVKTLYSDSKVINLIENSFPVIVVDKKIDLKKLSSLLFSDNNFKSEFERLIFPLVREKINDYFEKYFDCEKVFVIVPILFEAGFENLFDKIIFISAQENIRKQRLISRKSMLSEMAETVIKSQKSEDEKIIKCDYVVKNNGTLEEFKSAVENLLKTI